jgi:hypothetical protein
MESAALGTMNVSSDNWFWRPIGGLIGGAAGVVLGLPSWLALGGVAGFLVVLVGMIVVCLVLYVVAGRTTAAPVGGELMPGILLGFNAALNAVLLAWIVTPIAAVVVVALLPAWISAVARSDAYQAVLGWSNFVLPMSWIVTGLGLAMTLVSLLLWGVTAGRVEFLKVNSLPVDWKTGTFFMAGGLAGNSNLRAGSPGYNMGNWAFLRGDATVDAELTEHEAGHGLNLAAFGWVFHFIGAIDENVTGGHENAYSEKFAESNVPASTHPTLPLWGGT